MFLTTRRHRPARVALCIGLCLLLPVQPLFARGGGGGRGGGGFGGGGRGGGGSFGGGGADSTVVAGVSAEAVEVTAEEAILVAEALGSTAAGAQAGRRSAAGLEIIITVAAEGPASEISAAAVVTRSKEAATAPTSATVRVPATARMSVIEPTSATATSTITSTT